MPSTSRRAGAVALALACLLAGSVTGVARADTASAAVRGGSIVYGVDRLSASGWCLPTDRLGAGAAEVAQAVYETLTVPDARGRFVPYLARSVTPNPARTEWTITLRPGITFHDGSPFDAAAVVQNLDAYRTGPVFGASLGDVAAVETVDSLTVRVTTRVPWPAFPSYLWSAGRLGMVAPAQLADPLACARTLVGTGPFRVQRMESDGRVVAVRNDAYWQRNASGEPFPFLDQVTFRSVEDTLQRLNGLKGGDLDVIQLDDRQAIDIVRADATAGLVRLVVSERAPQVEMLLFNSGVPPFDRLACRRAVAFASDPAELLPPVESDDDTHVPVAQPFAPDSVGYRPHARPVTNDADRAAAALDRCREERSAAELRFTLHIADDSTAQVQAEAFRRQMDAAGIEVKVTADVGRDELRERATRGDYEAMLVRSDPSPDPDTFYAAWHSTTVDPTTGRPELNPSDVARVGDPVVDRLLERGRSASTATARHAASRELGRRLGTEAYGIWIGPVPWAVATQPAITGLRGPRLPSGDRRGAPVAGVEPVLRLRRTR